MSTQENFELLKSDYIQKTEVLLNEIKSLQLEEISNVGVKGRIAVLRNDVVSSYFKLLEFMTGIKVKV